MSLIGEDCHYFITSTCTRGNQCCFRHQPAARTTELPCPEWVKGKCLNPNCNLRHVSVDRARNNKSAILCFYENQPNGCLNPMCQFMHVKPRKNAAEPVIMNPTQLTNIETPIPANHVPNNTSGVVASVIHAPAAPKVFHTQVPLANTVIKQHMNPPTLLPPPAPVHPLVRPAGTASIVNGVLTIAPARGILGANPNQVPQVLPPLVTHHGGIRPQQIVATQPQFVSAPQISAQQSALPKTTGDFSEQVRLFKEMLNAKQRENDTKGSKSNKQYHSDDHNDNDSDKEDKRYRDKYNRRRNKKEKYGRSKKKSKEDLGKTDQEVLYGNYKDIVVEKKHKKSREQRHPHSDPDVKVKSYEEILREKALRKMLDAKRLKEKFDDDFEEIIGEKDNNESEGSKPATKTTRKESLDLENVVFDKADALEIGVDEEDLDELNEQKDKEPESEKERKNSSEKENIDSTLQSPKNETEAAGSEEEELDYNDDFVAPEFDGVLVIPDETTDLTFSVDETDDLALELNQAPEEGIKKERRKPSRSVKKSSNGVSSRSSSRGNLSSNDRRSERTSRHKRNIKVVDEETAESKKSKDDSVKRKELELVSKKVVTLVVAAPETTEKTTEPEVIVVDKPAVKVKTFEEIMEEKRKRKLMKCDIVVVSDSDNSLQSPDKKPKKTLLTEQPESNTVINKEPCKAKTAAMLRKERLQLAKQEYEKRRKSMQIYQVKGSGIQALPEKTVKTVKTIQPLKSVQPVKISTDRIKPPPSAKLGHPVKITKPTAATKLTTAAIKPTTATVVAPTTANGTDVNVRSFEEIMQEKKIRKQLEMIDQQKKIDYTPKQSFLRRRSLSNQRNNQTSASTEQAETLNVTDNKSIDRPKAASPVPKAVNLKLKTSPTPPVAKIIGRRRSSSPTVLLGEGKVAPVKLKRNLSTSSLSSNTLSATTSEIPAPIPESTNTISGKQQSDENNVFAGAMTTHRNKDGVEQELSQASMEDIHEALQEKKRQREQDILSDDEFEKEMDNLLSDGDDEGGDDTDDDVDDDDFMMELEQMIDS